MTELCPLKRYAQVQDVLLRRVSLLGQRKGNYRREHTEARGGSVFTMTGLPKEDVSVTCRVTEAAMG